jgi:hypothetical protein
VEALWASCALLFATDELHLNERNGPSARLPSGAFTRVERGDLDAVVDALHRYATNHHLLWRHQLRMHEQLARQVGEHMRGVDAEMAAALAAPMPAVA